MTPKPLLW